MAVHPLMRLLAVLLLLLAVACDRQPSEPAKPSGPDRPAAASAGDPPPASSGAVAEAGRESRPEPPGPPLFEDFEGEPRLSLFPRAGRVRPDEKDELYPFWRTYLEHLRRMTGILQIDGNRVFAFRGLKNVDSVGYFSPLAVAPATRYRVSVRMRTDLPDGSRAGVGIQEFDRFLWVPRQFDRQLEEKHLLASRTGIVLEGQNGWRRQQFTFTTGPKTRMIHLVLFIDGKTERKPVLFDDLRIEPIE